MIYSLVSVCLAAFRNSRTTATTLQGKLVPIYKTLHYMFVYLVKKPKPNRPFSNEEWVSANAVSYAGYIQLKQGGKTLELLSG